MERFDNGNYDIHIIGTGLAGLTLYKELKSKGKNVCLIESNICELNTCSISQSSLNHLSLTEYRHSGLGGTGVKWGGGCTLFEKEDFDKWHIDYDSMQKYYKKACDILQIDYSELIQKNNYEIFNSEFITNKFISGFNLISKIKGENVKNLLDKETIREISKDIFYFTVTNVENNILTLNDGKKEIKINYKKCVLCCGGLETARLLLNSGLKNENLGKYYSPHLSVKKGKCILNKNIRKNSMYSNNISKYFIYKNADGSSMRVIITDELDIIIQSDQIPNINSKIELTDDKDSFNNRNILLTHKAYDEDFERIIECYNDLDAELKKNNLGYVDDIPNLEDIKNLTCGASHHMGTTRFGKNIKDGVVDHNFKVFGMDNVYILSTSLFSTYSHAHPTLTLISLVFNFLDLF